MTLFKALNEDGSACHGGGGQWSLPHDGQPGEWMPAIAGPLVPCKNGYHLCEDAQVLEWLGPVIYGAEYRGEIVYCDDKLVVREARLLRRFAWDRRIARLFACDCAERVVHLCGDDPRPRVAIETARRFARNQATQEEMDAAGTAAWDAVWIPAGDAAGDAAWAAARAATGAAWDAAWAATKVAAWAAARAAARDVAWTGAASWTAAEDAAGNAAGAAAGAAGAVWAFQRAWQYARLMEYLEGEFRHGD